MKLVYCKLEPGNFGDELNPYLWPRLFPKAFAADGGTDFLGIGTILSPHMDRGGRRKVVFGTGAGYFEPPQMDEQWKVYFVRGPLTAKLLQMPAAAAITDAAYCLSFIDETTGASSGERGAVVFMPHHKSEEEVDWKGLCADLGWVYASPTAEVAPTLRVLKSARLVVTEAMHGAIVADHYRVPWVPVRYGFRSLDFKWRDWCDSLGIDYRPVDLPPLLDARLGARETVERMIKKAAGAVGVGKPAWKATPVFRSGGRARDKALKTLAAIATRGDGVLSADPVLQRARGRLWEQVERFRAEHEN